ncbi:hypothetical protein [Rugosimonospora africana]|uniref:Uncharacterized protein n=1 Tax=Rugosimonospora africana TaxID=556532 RepID=A0A8J3VWR3_9ACTN|nr:hypothetical protein [Rugosimonospora africana]GIH21174.1 hypothetical protein Raf01_93460 [Rugosimonospora africana]
MVDDDVLDGDVFGADVHRAFAAVLTNARMEPDPYGRMVRRARTRRLVRRAATGGLVAALATTAVAVSLTVPGDRPEPAGPQTGTPGMAIDSDWARRLIASPPRGSLSGDTAYMRALAKAVDRRRHSWNVWSDLDQVSILYAGDVGTSRVALVALHNRERAIAVWLGAPRAASADTLAAQSLIVSDRLEPFERGTYSGLPYHDTQDITYLVGVAPAGCVIDTASDAQHQQWRPTSTGSYVAQTQPTTADWWRVTCDGTVHYQGPAKGTSSMISLPQVSDTQLDAALAGARGTADRSIARYATRTLAAPDQHGRQTTGTPRVLWGGTTPGSNDPAVLAAVPVTGGWEVLFDYSNGQAGTNDLQSAFGVSTRVALDDPSSLYALRLANRTNSDPSGNVLVLAPRQAATVVSIASDGKEESRATLTQGTGWIVASNSAVLRALDSSGRQIASYQLDSKSDLLPVARPAIDTW